MVLHSTAFGCKGDPLIFYSLRATGIAQYGTKKKLAILSVACVMTLVEEQWFTRVKKNFQQFMLT